jgi:hypothetical protein
MILSQIRYLIGIHLGNKGFPPSIIAPVLNILRLMDEEHIAIGFDFQNPEIEKEVERLSQAIVMWNHQPDESDIITPVAFNLQGERIIEYEQKNNFSNIIELGWKEEDPTAFLDDDSE